VLAFRIPEELEQRLAKLSSLTGRPKSYYVREALKAQLDDIEDAYTALYRLEHPANRWPLAKLEREIDLKR
jgi:RHH-type rel operon transcriptional repressor/antitoxin RelB